MALNRKVTRFTAKIREPYMGNQVPIEIFIEVSQNTCEITCVEVKNPEGITVTAKRNGGEDV